MFGDVEAEVPVFIWVGVSGEKNTDLGSVAATKTKGPFQHRRC